MTHAAWVALVVGLVALIIGFVLMVRSRGTGAGESLDAAVSVDVVARPGQSLAPSADPLGIFETSLENVVLAGDTLVVPDPSDPELALVFGKTEVARSLGEVVGAVPGQLATVAVGADALVKAGIAVAEESGMLVRLTKESTRAMKELNQIKDGSGAVMGVLRDDGAKFRHLVKFKPQQGLQVASSATSVLSAVAMQAQLAAIERAVAELGHQVAQVREMLAISATAERVAVATVLMSTYQASSAAGVLSQGAWDQVASMAVTVEKVTEQARRDLDRLLDDLAAQRSTKARRSWMEKNRKALILALESVAQAERSRLQYSALRLWWLSATGDPLLEPYTDQMHQLIAAQETKRLELGARLGSLLDSAEQTWWWDHVHSPIDSRKMQALVRELSTTLREGGVVPAAVPPTPKVIEGPSTPAPDGVSRP
jgi:hypothetical protein